MNICVFGIKDTAAASFVQQFFALQPGIAIRGFSDTVNNSDPQRQSDMSNHPDDFELYKLGEFDVDTGLLTALPAPELLVRGKDLKQQQAAA